MSMPLLITCLLTAFPIGDDALARGAGAAPAAAIAPAPALAPASAQAPATVPAARPANDLADLVSTTYDLERLWSAPLEEQHKLRSLPFRFGYADDEYAENDPGWQAIPVDALASFLWDVVAPGEFEYEGRRLEADDHKVLHVTAPASVQADVRAALDYLAAVSQRQAHLDIDIWRTTGTGTLPESLDAAALSAAEASGTLVRVAARQEDIALGRTEERSALLQTRFLRDWEPEIAQRSALAQPEFETLRTGTLLLLRAEPRDDDHVTLRYVAQLSELLGIEHRTDTLRAVIHSESTSSIDVVAGVLDQPTVAFATLAGSRVLAPGDSFVTVARAQTLDGPAGYVLHYRLTAVDPDPAPLVLPGTPARVVRATDLSAALWSHLGARKPTADDCYPRAGEGEASTWLSFPGDERTDTESLRQRAGALTGDDSGAIRFMLGTLAVCGGEADRSDQLHAALAVQRPDRRSVTLQLELVESGGSAAARTVGRASLPLTTGDTGVVVLGVARMLADGIDVDVAEGASVPDINVAGCLDGLMLRARAGSDGSVALDVLSHRVMHRDRLDTRVPSFMQLDQVDVAVVSIACAAQPDGLWHDRKDIGIGLDGTQLALRWKLSMP